MAHDKPHDGPLSKEAFYQLILLHNNIGWETFSAAMTRSVSDHTVLLTKHPLSGPFKLQDLTLFKLKSPEISCLQPYSLL